MTLVAGTIFISYRIDAYHNKIDILQTKTIEQEILLEKLNESLNKRKFILKKIEIFNASEIDENDFALIKNSIRQKLDGLIGKEVKTIDTDLIIEIIDKRIMDTGIQQYQLKVTRLILSDSLDIWIDINVLK